MPTIDLLLTWCHCLFSFIQWLWIVCVFFFGTRDAFQIELNKITTVYENLLEGNERFLSESTQNLEAMKKSYNQLKKEV